MRGPTRVVVAAALLLTLVLTSAHLHFEVKPVGRSSVNPFPYAFNWCTADFTDPAAEVLLPGD